VVIIDERSGALVSSENPKARLGGVELDLVGTSVDAPALERGVELTLGGRVALLLRRARPASSIVELDTLGMVGPSPELQRIRERIRQLAPGEQPILITGATGTGKELVARALHAKSKRSDRPWVALNLAAIPTSTAASQLFGHTRGAFTGAQTGSAGLFGAASTGTLFLDELGESSRELQALLLRALESGEVQVVGGHAREVDVRVVAATDADLELAMSSGRISPALYHRLAGTTIALSPLRSRREDIAAQLGHFLVSHLRARGREDKLDHEWLGTELQRALIFHDWPGNTRQLLRVIEGMIIEDIDRPHARMPAVLGSSASSGTSAPALIAHDETPDTEERALARALEANDYQLTPTAKALGIALNTLKTMMKRHGYRRAKDLALAEIEAARAQVGGELSALARALRVSPHGLRIRLSELE
jgi:two-component system nitrogen regulation response regulator GlnG